MGLITHIYVYLTWSEEPTRTFFVDFYYASQFEMVNFAILIPIP